MDIVETTGNLLDLDVQYIAHQINATIIGEASGIAKAIFEKYPESDMYKYRENPAPMEKMGTISIHGRVINMLSQYYPGKPQGTGIDLYSMRNIWFQKCLNEIAMLYELKSIGFPHRIGCGLAGGNWLDYRRMLDNFAKKVPNTQIYIVQLV